ncbi:MAG: NAD(P)H-hydrate dehydratase, partial [Firmicutes bacterium]|nr:NAD(P)H-hydrate dehydratase [Candidatus Caballimonas caccae]
YKGVLIIDADGLNILSMYGTEILKKKKCDVILTPHIKEFSRLTKQGIEFIQENSLTLSKSFAKEFNVVLVLKSATTVISDGEKVYLNTVGSSGMAKGGSGDVLSGIIAGMCAKKKDIFDAVVASCYVFGKAGEFAEKEYNEYYMNPSDVICKINDVINSLLN